MLPSFRLIVATFLFSFVLVFASLRLVDSARLTQEPLSVPLAVLPQGGFPTQFAGIADRRGNDDIPAIFNIRFAAGTGTLAPIPASLTLHALGRAQEHSHHQEYNTGLDAEPIPEPAPVPQVTVEPLSAPATQAPLDERAWPHPQNRSETETIAPLAALPQGVTTPALEPKAIATPEASATATARSAAAAEPAAAATQLPATIEPLADSRVEVAALPQPQATPGDKSANTEPDLTASIDPDRPSPVAVPTAGTTRPTTAPVRRTKPKAARPDQKAIQARAARPRSSSPRTTAPATTPAAWWSSAPARSTS